MNEEIKEISPDTAAIKKFRLSSDHKTLLWCFAVPFFAMIAVYCALMVWPVGKNSVLVLDLNAQYIYYFEQLRDIITSGESLIYSFERALGGEFMGISLLSFKPLFLDRGT
ncbi:MAG: YfhO family protein, partial [Clostridia bacterium]|nr:YfhO family protein [Clostridia bacterium]